MAMASGKARAPASHALAEAIKFDPLLDNAKQVQRHVVHNAKQVQRHVVQKSTRLRRRILTGSADMRVRDYIKVRARLPRPHDRPPVRARAVLPLGPLAGRYD